MTVATLPGFQRFALLLVPFLLAAGAQAQAPSFLASPIKALSLDTYYFNADGSEQDAGRCGVDDLSAAQVEAIEAQIEAVRAVQGDDFGVRSVTTIPVAFHVVRSGTSISQGNVPQSRIDSQMNVLNAAFASTNFQFELDVVTRTTNSAWFNNCLSNENAMKSALNVDPATTLNFYTCTPGGFLGYATLPFSYPEGDFRHGAVVLHSSVPGGSAFPYNLGDTGTHEVGHYLGLFHTFQGGCFGSGDSVSDTPAEASPAFGCPVGRDTCSGGGPDPIRNFMDYVDDACMNEFTPGQAARMDAQVATFKPTLLQGGGANGEGSISVQITSSQTVPPSGGVISADFTLSNSSGSDFEGEWWIQVTFPNGNNGPRLGPFDVSLSDGQSMVESVAKNVPRSAPSGVYIVTANIGPDFPGEIDDSATFTFLKEGQLRPVAGETLDQTWTLENVTRGEVSEFAVSPAASRATATLGAYPTPFSSRTTVGYTLDAAADVQIDVYDVLGRRVAVLAEGLAEAGAHEAVFEAGDLPSGTYLVRLELGEQVQTQQITLMK
ncbi:MAG: M43 family zinc metalloprotease [Bacteroidota bacterium]